VGVRQLIIDAWSWLNYKPVMADPHRPGHRAFPELASGWVPDDDMRRLAAYKLLAAYDSNQAGQLAAVSGDVEGLERRELGDASKLIDTALGYLLGSEQAIVVPGAEHADDDDPPAGATEAAALQERLREWAEKELLPLRIQQTERCAVRVHFAWELPATRAMGSAMGTVRGSGASPTNSGRSARPPPRAAPLTAAPSVRKSLALTATPR
jgi:hypothetical protein